VADEALVSAAGRIADGELVDWASITSTLPSASDRAIADELAVVAQIAAGHRQLHQLLPVAADTPPHLMPDRARWGHLDLLNIVGRGSYGMVYRAWDTRLERLVALKLFHGASNPDTVMQEGRMLARVRHENVVTVYGADVIDGVAGLWMELVHGETLDRLVRKTGPMTPRDAAAIGADVAKALGAVHAAGLLHCDIKAQNVVRETTGRVVLMDLGAGRLVPEARDTDDLSDVAGTPRYMAPELFHSYSTATRGTDIYGFGVLLYYLVSGKFPVDGKTLGELRQAHAAGKMRPLASVRSDVPAGFSEIVARTIDRDPGKRPATADEVQAALAPLALEPDPEVRRWPIAWWAAIAAGAGVLALLLLSPLLMSPAPPAPEAPSIAVLPIKNLTGDPAKQYIADGLTEVLVAHLARLPGLEVASSATTATLSGFSGDEKAIADKLGVRLLLAGSVVQADNRISLSLKLTDPHAGRTIWGSELERQPSTILSARSEIANLVAARLALEAPPSDTRSRQEPAAAAQEAFLRGLVESASVSANDRMLDAERLFERAVALEPTWAEPLAHLALTQQYTTEFGNPLRRAERSEVVRANAVRAIQLDPTLPVSYTALAAVQAYHDWDLAGAEATLRQALNAAPRDGATRARMSLLLAAQGRLDEAVREAEQARDDEPLVADRYATLGVVRYYARDFDRSLVEYEKALAIAPDLVAALIGRARLLLALGRLDQAAASAGQAIAISPNPGFLATLALVNAAANRQDVVDENLRQLRVLEKQGRFVSVDNYAYIQAHRGRLDDAFRLVEEAIDRKMTNVLWLAVDPRADLLRGDPRFDRLIRRMGLISR